jgi:hypothetical protein
MQRFNSSFENTDRWFKSKISLLAYGESGKERKTSMYFFK